MTGGRAAVMVVVIAVAATLLSGLAQASPFHKGASLQVFTFPAVVDGRYADDPFPFRSGAAAFFGVSRLSAAGFDHVRLPVDVGPFLDDPGGRRWDGFRGDFRAFAEELHRSRLGIIVTLVAPSLNGQIPEDQLDGLGGAKFERYAAMTERFARELESWHLEALALEPMNEPQRSCIKPMRRTGPTIRTFCCGGSGGRRPLSGSGSPAAAGRRSRAWTSWVAISSGIRAHSSAFISTTPSCSRTRARTGRWTSCR